MSNVQLHTNGVYKETETLRDAVNNTVARLNLVRSWKTAGCGGGSAVRVPPKGPAAQAWAPLGSRTGRRVFEGPQRHNEPQPSQRQF